MTDVPAEQTLGNYLEIGYQEEEVNVSNTPVDQTSGNYLEIGYQEEEIAESCTPADQMLGNYAEVSYGERDIVKHVFPYMSEDIYYKFTVNILRFAFTGKMYLFDGKSVKEFPSSGSQVIFPMISFGDGKIVVYGGLKEDNTINNDIYIYGQNSYVVDIKKEGIAMIVAGDEPVYVYDESGNVKCRITTINAVPVMKGWRVASRKPFIVMFMGT